jgi:hypothetical protein
VKIQSSVLVHLGFGKYVRSDHVVSLIPVEQERGPGRRTIVHLQGLDKVNATVRRISRDEGGLDLDQLEGRITKVLED